MELQTQYEFLFVGRDEGDFLENYAYDVNENLQHGGQVFLCLDIQNNPGEAEAMGEAIFAELKRVFFEDLDVEPYVRFEQALKAVNMRLGDFRKGKLNTHIGRLHVVIAAIEHGVLYLSQCGDAEAYLVRKRFVSIVSEGLSDGLQQEGDLFTSVASGDLEPGDFVLFSTTRLLRYISKADVSRLVIPSDISRTLADIRDSLSTEILGKIALIGVRATLITDPATVAPADSGDTHLRVDRSSGQLKQLWSHAQKYGGALYGRVRSMELFSKTGGLGRWHSLVRERLHMPGMNKDKILALFLVVLVLLGVGTWFVRYRQLRSAEILGLDQTLNMARQQVSDAESQGQTDKRAAGVLLDDAEAKVRGVLTSAYERTKASEVLGQIQKARDLLDNLAHVPQPKVFADLSQQHIDGALGIVPGKDRFYVFDSSRVYEVILDKVQAPVAFESNDPVIAGTYFDERDVPIFFTKSGRMYELRDGALRQMSSQEGLFRKGVAITDWGSRVYVLDAESDQIWRYPYVKSKETFSPAEGYRTEGSVAGGVSFTIDSNVYVLKRDGTIVRFYGGVSQKMTIEKAPFSSMSDPRRIYTDGEMNRLYVLDSGEKSVYVYFKDPQSQNLVYLQQIVLDGIGDPRDLYFDKSTSRLYVIDQSKVYEVPIGT